MILSILLLLGGITFGFILGRQSVIISSSEEDDLPPPISPYKVHKEHQYRNVRGGGNDTVDYS